jgi:hypothetical protein
VSPFAVPAIIARRWAASALAYLGEETGAVGPNVGPSTGVELLDAPTKGMVESVGSCRGGCAEKICALAAGDVAFPSSTFSSSNRSTTATFGLWYRRCLQSITRPTRRTSTPPITPPMIAPNGGDARLVAAGCGEPSVARDDGVPTWV